MEKNKKTEEIKENTAAETDAFESEEDTTGILSDQVLMNCINC